MTLRKGSNKSIQGRKCTTLFPCAGDNFNWSSFESLQLNVLLDNMSH